MTLEDGGSTECRGGLDHRDAALVIKTPKLSTITVWPHSPQGLSFPLCEALSETSGHSMFNAQGDYCHYPPRSNIGAADRNEPNP